MAKAEKPFELTGRHVLFAVIAFFGIIIAVNFVFVKLAVQSFPGEQVEKSYYQGLNYNETLAEKARQAELGWRFQLVNGTAGAGAGAPLEVILLNREGRPVVDAVLEGELARPTSDEGLQQLGFTHLGEGRYRSDVEGLAPGAWDLTLKAREEVEGEIMLSATTRMLVR